MMCSGCYTVLYSDQQQPLLEGVKYYTLDPLHAKSKILVKNCSENFLDSHLDSLQSVHVLTAQTRLFWHYTSGDFHIQIPNISSGLVWRMSSCDTLTMSDCNVLGGKVNFTGYNMGSPWFTMTGVLWSVARCYTLRNRLQKFSSRSIGWTTWDWRWRLNDHSPLFGASGYFPSFWK